ncbi:MAG: response regulator [Actinomycetia bacterium]|nr:response regulator [Actinomycetes bacterium]
MPEVLVVDDSAFVRMVFGERWRARGYRVRTARDGTEALRLVQERAPDLVTMDVEMPGLSGVETVRALRAAGFAGRIIMVSGRTVAGARVTLEALEAGADDFVPKPGHPGEIARVLDVLQEKFRALTERVRPDARPVGSSGRVRTRDFDGVVVVASTGGPKALATLLADTPRPRLWLAIVQHMPAGFTKPFAERLSRLAGWPVVEVPPDGRPVALAAGQAVLAPGGRHLRLTTARAWAEDGPRRHGVIPSADVTIQDALAAMGPRLAVVVLTGMGEDGAGPAAEARRAGATVVAEAAETAVVWGMPGAVVARGGADAVWPLARIRAWLREVLAGGTAG